MVEKLHEFAPKPEEKKLEPYTTTKWRANFQIFSRALVAKAEVGCGKSCRTGMEASKWSGRGIFLGWQ
jgi:hypothetical protein